jgi:hypothetical protein
MDREAAELAQALVILVQKYAEYVQNSLVLPYVFRHIGSLLLPGFSLVFQAYQVPEKRPLLD